MSISGEKREQVDYQIPSKRIGIFEGRVIAINPTADEYKSVVGYDLKDDSKECDYLSENQDGNTVLRINVWLEDIKTSNRVDPERPDRYKVTFFLENKERENKDLTKKQYINNIGTCTWADDPNNLGQWFKDSGDYRVAYAGEEELYNFKRTWLSQLDYKKNVDGFLSEWKKLMKGNVKDLRDEINGEFCGNIGALATINTKEKDGEIHEYQSIFNKAFLPTYALKNFRLIDYSNPDVIASIKAKKPKDQKAHEKFVLAVTGEYGTKDSYILKDIKDYDPNDFLVSSDKVISEESADY
jgi:hypothetical protein